MTPEFLHNQIQSKKSFLCVGLDTDIRRIPKHLLDHEDPVFEFNRQIIEATKDFAVAYKPNLAFYEALGPSGWESLRKTMEVIPKEIFTIADAKRGDIGNTASLYARAFFETFDFDSVTLSPYMGADAVTPFLAYEGKWVFVLALTSNPGANDFQYHSDGKEPLYQRVIRMGQSWGKDLPGQVGFVIGATRGESMEEVRRLAPDAFFLVPGVGAQGGDLDAVCRFGKNNLDGILVNSSRGIIFAGQEEGFASAAGEAAKAIQSEMSKYF